MSPEHVDDRPMPQRLLGRTGRRVGIFSLGGQGGLEVKQKLQSDLVQMVRRAYELGVNYFDTSPVYGPSEEYYGEALSDVRDDIFLATKTHERTRDKSLRLLEKSFKRLRTDYVDLWQLHNIASVDEVDEVTKKGGVLEALTEMWDQGAVKFIGFTGHESPAPLLELARRFQFDTVLCAVNAADRHVKPSFIETLLPEANEQGLGIIGMKVFAQGYVFHPEGITTAREALTYAMSLSLSTVIAGCDSVEQLEENVAIAKSFVPQSNDQLSQTERKTTGYVERAQFFRKQFEGYGSREKLGDVFPATK
jgi:hypothetical protein